MKNLSDVSEIRKKSISYILFLLENELIHAVAQGKDSFVFTISIDFTSDVQDTLLNANYTFNIRPAMEKLSEFSYVKSDKFVEIEIKLK